MFFGGGGRGGFPFDFGKLPTRHNQLVMQTNSLMVALSRQRERTMAPSDAREISFDQANSQMKNASF